MERLHNCAIDFVPCDIFRGNTLFLIAKESREFHKAREVNAKYCQFMEIRQCPGNHCTLINKDNAAVAAGFIHLFASATGSACAHAHDGTISSTSTSFGIANDGTFSSTTSEFPSKAEVED